MTSSLVGSEMCIRDRKSTMHLVQSRMHPSFWLMIKGKKPEAKVTMAEPVSYTHLTLPTICSV
eukprot:9465379-Prorocentrum_lima.AAC.1